MQQRIHATPAIERFHLDGPDRTRIPCTLLRSSPAATDTCLFLYGGGGDAENLTELAPHLARAWSEHALPPMIIACAGVSRWGFYLDREEQVVGTQLLAELRKNFGAGPAAGLVGMSMGGYGALKIAFAQPETFGAVAAISPMIEPALDLRRTPPRNRFHYPPEIPAAMFQADHPARRAIDNAEVIRRSALAIYIDAASRDALNAHDGAEFLHRVLWDLDLRHEYHLLRDANHVGDSILPRLLEAFRWVGAHLVEREPHESQLERDLRRMLTPARLLAEQKDPNTSRVYGVFAKD